MCAKCFRASSAASCWRTTTTCRLAISSKPTAWCACSVRSVRSSGGARRGSLAPPHRLLWMEDVHIASVLSLAVGSPCLQVVCWEVETVWWGCSPPCVAGEVDRRPHSPEVSYGKELASGSAWRGHRPGAERPDTHTYERSARRLCEHHRRRSLRRSE